MRMRLTLAAWADNRELGWQNRRLLDDQAVCVAERICRKS